MILHKTLETNISFKKPKYPVVKSYGTPRARGTSKKHSETDSYTLNQMLHLYGFGNLFLPTENYGFDDSVVINFCCFSSNDKIFFSIAMMEIKSIPIVIMEITMINTVQIIIITIISIVITILEVTPTMQITITMTIVQ